MKYDNDKLDYTLLPFDALEKVTKVLEFGAKKYARDNWKTVEKSRYMKACLRHIFAYIRGEEKDSESGESHLSHAACCLLFMLSDYKVKK